MSNVEIVEQNVKAFSESELAEFRDWFAEYDWAVWDAQIEREPKSGKLAKMASKALADHAAGLSRPL